MQTPSGMPFYLVPFSGESQRSSVIDPNVPHAVDQICLDTPHDAFEEDVAFWSKLTGWFQIE